ncbi:uncharacterized protein BCR38DRAFT_474945 [Pseudomassariella vexata]|uniref:Uncharacterized protein n=1 Tax=Pseudomassariella vexata TaxID=1141098 RepID=A0A1Y2DZ09_9PEZI|nr:uncharacterized protein BCR38DRAFT_474945 [Pseudomassariella vexata]ORY64493.1 hypothetical protein BCR38DRAFT_474945 [Pseudomassariella vexata]
MAEATALLEWISLAQILHQVNDNFDLLGKLIKRENLGLERRQAEEVRREVLAALQELVHPSVELFWTGTAFQQDVLAESLASRQLATGNYQVSYPNLQGSHKHLCLIDDFGFNYPFSAARFDSTSGLPEWLLYAKARGQQHAKTQGVITQTTIQDLWNDFTRLSALQTRRTQPSADALVSYPTAHLMRKPRDRLSETHYDSTRLRQLRRLARPWLRLTPSGDIIYSPTAEIMNRTPETISENHYDESHHRQLRRPVRLTKTRQHQYSIVQRASSSLPYRCVPSVHTDTAGLTFTSTQQHHISAPSRSAKNRLVMVQSCQKAIQWPSLEADAFDDTHAYQAINRAGAHNFLQLLEWVPPPPRQFTQDQILHEIWLCCWNEYKYTPLNCNICRTIYDANLLMARRRILPASNNIAYNAGPTDIRKLIYYRLKIEETPPPASVSFCVPRTQSIPDQLDDLRRCLERYMECSQERRGAQNSFGDITYEVNLINEQTFDDPWDVSYPTEIMPPRPPLLCVTNRHEFCPRRLTALRPENSENDIPANSPTRQNSRRSDNASPSNTLHRSMLQFR